LFMLLVIAGAVYFGISRLLGPKQPLTSYTMPYVQDFENIGPLAVIQKNITTLLAGALNKGWLTILWKISMMLFFLAMVPVVWWKLGEGYAIYVLIMLLVPASSATGSIIRYVLTMFPVFIVLGDLARPSWLNRSLTAALAILSGLFVVLFVNWIFVA
jgi:hypothetical protein